MSGPKIDHAELERQRKIALERERQERLRQIRLSTGEYRRVQSKCHAFCEQITRDMAGAMHEVAACEEMSYTLQRIYELKETYRKSIEALANVTLPTTPDEIYALAAKLDIESEKMLREYKESAADMLARIQEFHESTRQLENDNSFSNQLVGHNEDSAIFVDFDFCKDKVLHCGNVSGRLKDEAEESLDEIRELVNNSAITYCDRKELMEFAKHILDASQCGEGALQGAVKEYTIGRIGIVQRIQEFEEAYQDYLAEYVTYLSEITERSGNHKKMMPKTMSDFSSVDELVQETVRIQQISQSENEQNYIRSQLNEVMAMFGYDLCEDIVLDPTQKGHHYLSKSGNDSTAIHIHVSETKQMMMEIVGTGIMDEQREKNVDAVIHDGMSADDPDTKDILAAQGRFCAMHPQIVVELKKRGVILNEKIHRAPDIKYCKRIYRVADREREESEYSARTSKKQKMTGTKTKRAEIG